MKAKETGNSEMEVMTEQETEKTQEAEQRDSIFKHENKEITINLESLKEKVLWCRDKIRQKVDRYLIPIKKPLIAKRKLIIPAAAVLAAGAMAAVYCVEHTGYRGTLNQIVSTVNNREGDLNVIAGVLLPGEVKECYKETVEIISDNIFVDNALKSMEADLDAQYARLDDSFGSKAKISVKVLEKEKMSKSQIRRAQHAYQEYYEAYWENLVTTIDEFDYEKVGSIAKRLGFLTSDVMTVRENIDILADFLKDMDIERGYNLALELQIKGSKDSYSTKLELRVIKVSGEWMIDGMSIDKVERTLQSFGSNMDNILWIL